MGEIGHLEDEALKRKQRLAALKRKLEGGQNSESSKKTPDDDLPVPIFRDAYFRTKKEKFIYAARTILY